MSCTIYINYDKTLSKITNKNKEECIVNTGLTFIMFLHFIFSSYPEIQNKFPAGTLAFKLNDKRPNEHDILEDGDVVSFYI